jgi:hypothetical protein
MNLAVALAWLTEMDRRILLEFNQHEATPTISVGWRDKEKSHDRGHGESVHGSASEFVGAKLDGANSSGAGLGCVTP